MAAFVIDEWLWSDASGENCEQKQNEAFRFLEKVYQKCDRFIIVKGSPFEQKAFSVFRKSDFRARRIAKFYKAHFWYNSDKSVLFEFNELCELQESLAEEVHSDDQYLVRAYLTAGADTILTIVTTDERLKVTLEKHSIQCKLREEFLDVYLG